MATACLLVLVPALPAPPPQRRIFVQTASNMLPSAAPATFRAWPALNDENTRRSVNAGRRFRLHLQNSSTEDPTLELFQGDTLMNRFALALARRKAIDRKEFFESTEFFARTRSKLRADGGSTLVDVAGGHGLVGCLVAIFMAKQFERIIIRDLRRPAAFDEVLAAAVEAAPWVEGRVVYEEEKVGLHAPLPQGCAVVCVHGCKGLTEKLSLLLPMPTLDPLRVCPAATGLRPAARRRRCAFRLARHSRLI